MKIVGINGSGRKGGNTAALVRGILDGAKTSGAETQLLELADWNFRGCDANRACKSAHRCIVKDDMQRFYDLAPETDVLVLGTPIYLDHITAQTMTFIQRLYCYITADLTSAWPRKDVRLVLAITYGWTDPAGYDEILSWMGERFSFYFQIPTIGKFKVHSTTESPFITVKHPEVERAFVFGKSICKR